jgi:dTDP-4-dehydrorhamnose reductase
MLIILGADGQLGSACLRHWGDQAIGLTRAEVDLSQPTSLGGQLDQYLQPGSTLINTAAYTKVDLAERETERELCHTINAVAVSVLAQLCSARNVKLVQISTDYVFENDPPLGRPWTEDDQPLPHGIYAQSKLAGEQAASAARKHLIIRTCGLYGPLQKPGQGNFVNTMLRLGREKPLLRVVNDQHCTPTYVADLVTGIEALLRVNAIGLYHVVNQGEVTWFDFARQILCSAGITTPIEPITTAQFGAAAPRPKYSVLSTAKLTAATGYQLPHWEAALARYLNDQHSC